MHLPGFCVLVCTFYVHDSLSDSSGRKDCNCKISQQLSMFGAPPKYPPGPRGQVFSVSFWLHQAAKCRGQWCSPISRWFRAASSLFKHHPGPGMLRPYTNASEVAGQLNTRGEECTQHGAQCISDKNAHTRMYVCVVCVCVCVCACNSRVQLQGKRKDTWRTAKMAQDPPIPHLPKGHCRFLDLKFGLLLFPEALIRKMVAKRIKVES